MSARISPLPAPVQRDPMIGQLVGGRYRIDRIHAQGGMSVVYAAFYEAQQREVAVKVIDDAYSSDPKAIDRFIKEARTASSISHGHVVGVSDYGILTNGRPYLVMPLITGQDLATLVAEQGPLPANRVVNLLSGVASALDWMHAQGLVHRDIKSENIMHVCGDDGTESALVLDFGIAARASVEDDDASGTPDFMAPEVLAGEPSDHRADIYSLATVAFELLAGRLPFQGNDLPELLRNRAKHRPRTLAEVTRISFHPALEAAIARGLAKRPSDRPNSASELVLELRRAVARARAPLSAPKSQGNAQAMPQAKPAAPQSGVRRTARRRPVVRLRTLVGFPFSGAMASSVPPPPERAPEQLPSIIVDPSLGPAGERQHAEQGPAAGPTESSGTRRISELAGAPRAEPPPLEQAAVPRAAPQARPIAELRLDPIAPRAPAPLDSLSPLPELELELKPPMRAGYIALRFGLPAAAVIAIIALVTSSGDDAAPTTTSSASVASVASDTTPTPPPAPSMAAPSSTPSMAAPAAVVEAPPAPPAPEPQVAAPAPAAPTKAPSAALPRTKPEPRAARAPREAKSEPKTERPTAPRAPRGDAQALATEGVDAMLRGDFTTALSKLEAATDADPRYAPAFRSKGLLLQRINRPKEAATAFRQYLRLSPNAPDTAKIKARLDSLE